MIRKIYSTSLELFGNRCFFFLKNEESGLIIKLNSSSLSKYDFILAVQRSKNNSKLSKMKLFFKIHKNYTVSWKYISVLQLSKKSIVCLDNELLRAEKSSLKILSRNPLMKCDVGSKH